jgi:hypothetical protein
MLTFDALLLVLNVKALLRQACVVRIYCMRSVWATSLDIYSAQRGLRTFLHLQSVVDATADMLMRAHTIHVRVPVCVIVVVVVGFKCQQR